jgi:hypothetical protein
MNTGWRAISASGRPVRARLRRLVRREVGSTTAPARPAPRPPARGRRRQTAPAAPSRVALARFGPMKAPMMPPASTQEMAFSLNRAASSSARQNGTARVGAVEAGQHRGRTSSQKLPMPDRQAHSAADSAATTQPDLERALRPTRACSARHRHRRERGADHVAGHRQRGHPAQRRQRQADQAVDGDEGDVVGQEQALAQGEQQQISVHAPDDRIASDRHPGRTNTASSCGCRGALKVHGCTSPPPREARSLLVRFVAVCLLRGVVN